MSPCPSSSPTSSLEPSLPLHPHSASASSETPDPQRAYNSHSFQHLKCSVSRSAGTLVDPHVTSQIPISLETLGFRAARYGGSDPDCTKVYPAWGQVGTEAESSFILSSKVPRGVAFFKLHKNALLEVVQTGSLGGFSPVV